MALPGISFNPEELLGRLMGDRQLAEMVLKAFLKDAPTQLVNLRACLREADASSARMQAHALSGAAATVAAENLHAVAKAIEAAGAAGRLSQCGELLPRAEEEFESLKTALKQAAWL